MRTPASILAAAVTIVAAATSAAPANAITGGSIALNPDPAQAGKPLTFTVVTEGAQGALTYDWDFGGNGSYETSGDPSNTKTVNVGIDNPSSATINVYVNDAGGGSMLISRTFPITPFVDTRPLVATLTAKPQKLQKAIVSGFLFSVTSSHSAKLNVTMSAIVGKQKLRFARFEDSVNATLTTTGQRNLSRYPAISSKAGKALRRVKRAKILVEVKVTDERGQVKNLAKAFVVRR